MSIYLLDGEDNVLGWVDVLVAKVTGDRLRSRSQLIP